MAYHIKKVGIIGAGTMGASIAAHIANAGFSVVLLDIIPTSLTQDQKQQELSLNDRVVRDSIVQQGFMRMVKTKPAPFMSKEAQGLVLLGNVEDDFDLLSEADWIIEAVIEQLAPKQKVMEKIEAICKPNSIITSNTSGLPIASFVEGRSDNFKTHFFGTHFFNPPRYMKLLEIISTPDCSAEAINAIVDFAENKLGKGIVYCKDTPNFIGNRMMSIDGAFIAHYAFSNGYSIEEVDAITGPLIGRPKTATFRLQDLIGIDIAAGVADNLYDLIPDDVYRKVIRSPEGTQTIKELLARGWFGHKTDQGFYKRAKDAEGKTVHLVLNPNTFEYLPPKKPRFASIDKVRKIEDIGKRLRVLFSKDWLDDRAAQLARAVVSHHLAYAAAKVPEITDDLINIDQAIRWGFSYEAGPFELWDMLGVSETVKMIEAEGLTVATWVKEMLNSGYSTFYQYQNNKKVGYYALGPKTYQPIMPDPRKIIIDDLRSEGRELERNASASLLDLGDGVLLLEFHAKMNAIDEDIIKMMLSAQKRLNQDRVIGLVIGNQGENFCVGANIFPVAMSAQQGMFDQISTAVSSLQNALMAFRYSAKPVVAAPFGMVLGGGAEIILNASRRVAHAESYIGLVEVGVGLIPAGGGVKEMVRRVLSKPMAQHDQLDALPIVGAIFQTIGQAKVGTSAAESKELGFLDEQDRIVMNKDHLLYEAKQTVLRMVTEGFSAPEPTKLYAAGRDTLAALKMGIWLFKQSGAISNYDAVIGEKLAYTLCGGDLTGEQWVDEQYFLDLEREAFVALTKQPKTVERIWYMLQNGKPLRN